MASVQSTIRFIEDHGHFATATAEGILAISWEGGAAYAAALDIEEGDEWCEAPMVFPIVDGNVSTRAVRDWLGY